MAEPTTVNGQITDAVTQSNTKVIGEAPAMAMATLYQSTAQALGMAAQNAVYAQQQMAVSVQAATTMGATHIYSLTGADTPQSISANLTNEKASLLEQVNKAPINEQIEEAINQSLKSVLGSAGDVGHAIRTVMDSFVSSMEKISAAQYKSGLDIIKIAAISSLLTVMINKPENTDSYQKILEIIESL